MYTKLVQSIFIILCFTLLWPSLPVTAAQQQTNTNTNSLKLKATKAKKMGATKSRAARKIIVPKIVIRSASLASMKFPKPKLFASTKAIMKVTVSNVHAAKTGSFAISILVNSRQIAKADIRRGMSPRASVSRNIQIHLPKRHGQQCFLVRLKNTSRTKLILGGSRNVCVKLHSIVKKPKIKKHTPISPRPHVKRIISRKNIPVVRTTKTKFTKSIIANSLKVNNSTGPVTVYAGGRPMQVRWNINSPIQHNRLLLSITDDVAKTDCSTQATRSGPPAVHGEGFYRDGPGYIGADIKDFANFVPGKTYYFFACLWNRSKGVDEYAGDQTNVVVVRYEPEKPDLVISKIELSHLNNNTSRVNFTVKNIGGRNKARLCTLLRPEGCQNGSMDYTVTVIPYLRNAVRINKSSILNMVHLAPGAEFREPVGKVFANAKSYHIVACINKNRFVKEKNYNNNCKRVTIYRKVRVTIDRIVVHGDGDNLTKGDWIVVLDKDQPFKRHRWPTSGSRNVDTGSTVRPNLTFNQTMYSGQSLKFTVAVIDCDHKGIGSFLRYGFEFDKTGIECSGEEVIEDNGKSEHVAKKYVIPHYTWQAGTGIRILSHRLKHRKLDVTIHVRIEVLR